MVDRAVFHQSPGKQRWAAGWVWRREHRLQLASLGVGCLAVIAAFLTLFFKK